MRKTFIDSFMYKDQQLYVAHSSEGPIYIIGKMANRHGLIAGATGTGKTVTLQVLAETFSQAGVPCFMADMKGDLSGISQTGGLSKFIEKRCAEWQMDTTSLKFEGCPVRFYDVYGEQGHPMRTTIEKMGPVLLARLLDLNDTQTGVLTLTFRIAKDEQLPLIDMKDLRLMLDYVAKDAKRYETTYGNISSASIGAIQRSLLALAEQGGDKFFGEPAFDIYDLLQTEGGRGVMNILAADKLMLQPKLYSTFLMWLLTDIYEKMPEIGDMELPKMVFFFDEAHMLFKDTSKALTDKIEADRPKTIFADAVTASTTSILVRDLAKMIRQNGVEIGEKRLYKWMRDNGYICKGNTSPTQRAMEMGLFEIEAITIKRADQLPIERRTTKVTGKGQVYFCNKFLNEVSA